MTIRLGRGAITLLARGPCPGCGAPALPLGFAVDEAGQRRVDSEGKPILVAGPHRMVPAQGRPGFTECAVTGNPVEAQGAIIQLRVACPKCHSLTTLMPPADSTGPGAVDVGPSGASPHGRLVLRPHNCAAGGDGEAVELFDEEQKGNI